MPQDFVKYITETGQLPGSDFLDGYKSLVQVFSLAIAASGEKYFECNIPFDGYLKSLEYGNKTAIDSGDTVEIELCDSSGYVTNMLVENGELIAADSYIGVEMWEKLGIESLDILRVREISGGATGKTLFITVEFLVPDGFILIDSCQKTTLWIDYKGADRYGVTAATTTVTADTTVYKYGSKSVKGAVTAVDVGNDEYAVLELNKQGGWNLSSATTLKAYFRVSVASLQDWGLSVEDSSGNISYWTWTDPGANTWVLKSCTLASPTGNNGTAADLSKITKVRVYAKNKAVATDFDMYVDCVHVI